ncbi:nucleoside hydrolase-like domain-containing protein [Novosphingobium rosa]|uniref:nucleoside hydrolase-like domain-containing protein n=1 Tax=Novosphingobium rosa TaxID=76978 RepID=UPI000A58FDA5|nr:nucleoside hydrolase-like domain-containing protein [Novosphingobium rosa]
MTLARTMTRLLLASALASALPASTFAATEPTRDTAVPGITYLETPPGQKPRVVITADPELDDNNSMIRYLLRSSDFRTEGLIYASSQFHWKGDGKGTTQSVPGREYTRFGLHLCPCTSYRWGPNERFIDDEVEAYAKAYPNLKVHDHDYPTPELLKSKIRWGNVDFDGEMDHDTPGSDLIKSLLLDDEQSPVYLHAWGGGSTIARALKSIEDQYSNTPQWAAIRARVIAKAVIHPSGDQDDTYAKYIKPHWPEIRYRHQEGGVPLGYATQSTASPSDAAYFTAAWMQAHVSSKGPLGANERVWGDGKQMVKGDIFDFFGLPNQSAKELKQKGYIVWAPPLPKGEFLGEGDTPTFLNLIDNGLRGYRGDSFGGWGGTWKVVDPNAPTKSFGADMMAQIERQVKDTNYMPPPRPRQPTNPFLAPVMNDLAARLAWATTPTYAGANHYPHIKLEGPDYIAAKPGQLIQLKATTSDPDGNRVTLRWWPWDKAGTYAGTITLDKSEGESTSFHVPADAKPGDQLQIVAEATDDGKVPLTRYEKVVVNVTA